MTHTRQRQSRAMAIRLAIVLGLILGATGTAMAEGEEPKPIALEPIADDAIPPESISADPMPIDPMADEVVPPEPLPDDPMPIDPMADEVVPPEPLSDDPMPIDPMADEVVPPEPLSADPMPIDPMADEVVPPEPLSDAPMPIDPAPAKAISAEAMFKEAYRALVRADEARDAEDAVAAAELYAEAVAKYRSIANRYPGMQPRVVKFRTIYCNDQLGAVLRRLDAAEPARELPTAEPMGSPPPPPGQDFQMEPLGRSSVTRPALDITTVRSRAEHFLRTGETGAARDYLFEALNAYPDDPSVRLLMAMVQCQAGRYKDATYLLEQLIEEKPSYAQAHVVLGTALFGLDQLTEAEAEMAIALRINPDLPEAHYNMVQILLEKSEPDLAAARRHYERLIELGARPDAAIEARLE